MDTGRQHSLRRAQGEVEEINRIAEAEQERELAEIREGRALASGGSASTVLAPGMERSFARKPLYEAFRSAGFARGKLAETP